MAQTRQNPKRTNNKDAARRSRKVCQFCKDKTEWIDYKDVNLLRKFVSDRGKIRARRVTGNCSQHQRAVAVAVKTTREIGLLPYSQRTTTERTGRPPRSDRRDSSGDVESRSSDADDSSTTAADVPADVVTDEEEEV